MRTVEALMRNNRKHPSGERSEPEPSKRSRDERGSRESQGKDDRRYGDRGQQRYREDSQDESYDQGYQIPKRGRALTPPARNQRDEDQHQRRTPQRRVLELEHSSMDEYPVAAVHDRPRRGYETTKYSRDKKLTGIVFQKVNLKNIRKQVEKLMEIFDVVGTLLVLPTKESIDLPISQQWRRIQCKTVLDKGSFLLHLFIEIHEFFNNHGLPTRNKRELTWQIFQAFPARNGILEGIMEEEILEQTDQEIEGMIRGLVSGGVWDQLNNGVQILTTTMAVTASPRYQLNHHHPDLGLRDGPCKPTMMETYDVVENTYWKDRLLILQRTVGQKPLTNMERVNIVAKRWDIYPLAFKQLHQTQEVFSMEQGKPSLSQIKSANGLPATREDVKEVMERMINAIIAPLRAEQKILVNQINRMEQILSGMTGITMAPEVITLTGDNKTVEMQVPVLNLTMDPRNIPQQDSWAEQVEREDAQRYGQSHVQVTMANDEGTLLCYNTESI